MPITIGSVSTQEITDQKTKEKHTRICVTLTNDGAQPEKRRVTFYRELIPKGGARPSVPAPSQPLCTTDEKTVPAKKSVPHGSADGTETFCCDLTYELALDNAFGTEHIVTVAGPKKDTEKHIPLDHGSEQKSAEPNKTSRATRDYMTADTPH